MSLKVGRNDPCVCGSGKKYKKCCLNLKKVIDSSESNKSKPKGMLTTTTGEIFYAIRMLYEVKDEALLIKVFNKLKCMDRDEKNKRWVVLYEDECLSFECQGTTHRQVSKNGSVVFASLTFKDGQLRIDVRSVERAVYLLKLFDKYITDDVARVFGAWQYNKLIAAHKDEPILMYGFNYDLYFKDRKVYEDTVMTEEKSNKMLEEIKAILDEGGEITDYKPFQEVEFSMVRSHDVDEIKRFETSCTMSKHVAREHFLGNNDYKIGDYIKEIVGSPEFIDKNNSLEERHL